MARADMFMSDLHCFIIRNVTLVYWTPVCRCDGFVVACGTGGWLRGSSRCHRRLLGRHYDNLNNQWIQFKHVIDVQALSVWWGFRHWRHWRFPIMKISSAASGASFASRWLQLCPGEQLLSLRWDYIYWQLNSYPTLLWYRWVCLFFVCIFHWYFTSVFMSVYVGVTYLSSLVALWAVSVTTREAPAAMRSLLWRRYSQCLIYLARH